MIADLYEVFRTPQEMGIFSFANADHHRAVSDFIFKSTSVLMPYYVLDPIPDFDLQNWLRRHQDYHNQVNAILNVPGNDLSGVDFKNQQQLYEWLFLHASEHVQWQTTTGVG